jgi:hypothetical protein
MSCWCQGRLKEQCWCRWLMSLSMSRWVLDVLILSYNSDIRMSCWCQGRLKEQCWCKWLMSPSTSRWVLMWNDTSQFCY